MDAIWSSIVVVLAFTGTFLAIDASTKTATRDMRKTVAYDLAQNEMDRLRKLGDTNLPALLALDNKNTPPASPSRTITLDGQDYPVWIRAYYVESVGTDLTDACGVASSTAAGQSASMIYLKVTVGWPGLYGPSGVAAFKPASLEMFFSAEGANLQNNTGTIRIYLTRENGDELVGRTVRLYKMPANALVDTQITNANGCVLFTGLGRSKYEVRVPSTNEYDLFMTTNPVNVPMRLVAGGTISRTIKIDFPLTVVPSFVTKTTSGGADVSLTPGAVGTNSFVGKWIAYDNGINRDEAEFANSGLSFMPHANATITNKVYPLTTGYSAFAGPCDVNSPGISNLVTLPATGETSTWVPGGTYTGARTLRLPNFRIQLLNTSSAVTNTGMILVKLKDKVGGSTVSPVCGQYSSMLNTWIRLPGQVDSGGWLTAQAYALPPGRYDICARQRFPSGSPSTRYLHFINQDNANYPNPTTVTMDVRGSSSAGTSTCGSTSGDWSTHP